MHLYFILCIRGNTNRIWSFSFFLRPVIDDAPDTIRVVRKEEASGKLDMEAQTWDDLHVYTATCLAEGTGMFAVMVGNYIREESKDS